MGKSTKSINKENIQNKLKKLKIFAKMKRIVLTFVIFLIASSYSNPLPSGTISDNSGQNSTSSDIRLLNGDGHVDEVVNQMTEGVEMSKENLNKIRGFLKKIDDMVMVVNQKISEVRIEMGSVYADKYRITKQASETYRKVKSILRRTRLELFKLADKTIRVTDDVLLYLKGWGPNYDVKEKKVYFKIQMKLLQDLIEESRTTLNDAETKYNDAADKIDEVDGDLTEFLQSLKKILDSNILKNAAFVNRMRRNVYGGSAGAVVGAIVLDLLGCSGICSAIAGTAVVTGTISMETSFDNVDDTFKRFEEAVSDTDTKVRELKNQFVEILLPFIMEETGLIQRWQNAIEHLDEKMEYAKDEEFFKLSIYRKSFEKAVRSLKVAATKFNERPKEIFGNDRK